MRRLHVAMVGLAAAVMLLAACEGPPWEMPCPEGWVMDADQNCYDPAGDDDSAGDDDDTTPADDDDTTPADDDDTTPADDDDTTPADDDDSAAGDDDDTSGAGTDFALLDGNSTSDTFGQTLRLSDQVGQPVFLFFAYSTCPDCQDCADRMQAQFDARPGWDGAVQIWFINFPNMDPDEPDLVDGYHLPVLQDTYNDMVFSAWGASQYDHWIIAPDGTVAYFGTEIDCAVDIVILADLLDGLIGS